jgi:putative ABC transport system permease protein
MPVIWLLVRRYDQLMNTLLKENIAVSVDSIRSHMTRSVLTILIIGFGIMALVGILTSIDAIKFFLEKNFTMMGANTFTIRNKQMRMEGASKSSFAKNSRVITWQEARAFSEQFTFPSQTSISMFATHTATVKYESKKTYPNVPVIGTDEHYLATSGYEIEKGRNFSSTETFYGSHSIILSAEIAKKLFGKEIDPIDRIVSVGPARYKVIGVLKSKGASLTGADNLCLLPVTTVRQVYSKPGASFSISVLVLDPTQMDAAVGEAYGLMRIIRDAHPTEEDPFEITKSDNLSTMLFDNLKYLRLAATIIGVITLFGAAIGLMNIMLVSVTERTREIGIRKAMGANKVTIRNQFLMEAIVIGQIGGAVGIILGIGIGNVLAMIIGAGFIVPWAWIILGVTLCFIVAILSGLIPALKAAALDPVESLRYE